MTFQRCIRTAAAVAALSLAQVGLAASARAADPPTHAIPANVNDSGIDPSRGQNLVWLLVTVLGASEQLANLIHKVIDATSLPAAIKTQLTASLQSLAAGFDPNKPLQRIGACLTLKSFTTLVRFVVPSAQAGEWTADANRIRAVLAC